MIAVCLLTADRPQYTRATLESFAAHHPGYRTRFVLLHADDGSQAADNLALAALFGFSTVYASALRAGSGPALRRMWRRAWELRAWRILHLENDWEFERAVPEERAAPCVRLYGSTKARGGERAPSGTRNLVTGEMVTWRGNGPGWELGVTHWGGPPSITDAAPLLGAVQSADRIKDISARLQFPTLRPLDNIVWHIGEEPTPGALG